MAVQRKSGTSVVFHDTIFLQSKVIVNECYSKIVLEVLRSYNVSKLKILSEIFKKFYDFKDF